MWAWTRSPWSLQRLIDQKTFGVVSNNNIGTKPIAESGWVPGISLGGAGTIFGLVFLTLPIGIADPARRLRAIKKEMDGLKQSPEALVAFGVLSLMGLAPVEVEQAGLRFFGSKATAVLTNVPGPRQPLYLAGRKIGKVMFWVPQSGHLGIGISIISYEGGVMLGIATDARLVPDPERIVEAFKVEFEAMRAAGAKLAKGRSKPTRGRSAAAR